MRGYEMSRGSHRCYADVVDSDGRRRPLEPRNDLQNHSPDGFGWGYGGSGPAQLALALLADHLIATMDDREAAEALAIRNHQQFKSDVVAKAERRQWRLDSEQIERWVQENARKPTTAVPD